MAAPSAHVASYDHAEQQSSSSSAIRAYGVIARSDVDSAALAATLRAASAPFSSWVVAESEAEALSALSANPAIDFVLAPSDAAFASASASASVSASASLAQGIRDRDLRIEQLEAKLSQFTAETQRRQSDIVDKFQALLVKYEKEKARTSTILWDEVFPLLADTLILPRIDKQLVESASQVGDYHLGLRLGSGHFSTVCAATHRLNSEKAFAMKMVDKTRIKSVAALRRLHNEVQVLRTLSHPSIPRLFDVMHSTRFLHLVCENGGSDLFELLAQHHEHQRALGAPDDGIDPAISRQLVAGVLGAVAHAHRIGFVHRDLKPENITWRCDARQRYDVKVIDWGLCAQIEPQTGGHGAAEEPSARHVMRDFCGSPGFFAPEMVTAGAYNGTAADRWSIGAISLELALGHELFNREWMGSYTEALMATPAGFGRRISAVVAQLPHVRMTSPALRTVVLQLLRLAPAERVAVSELLRSPWFSAADSAHMARPRAGVLPRKCCAVEWVLFPGPCNNDAWAPRAPCNRRVGIVRRHL